MHDAEDLAQETARPPRTGPYISRNVSYFDPALARLFVLPAELPG